MYHRRILPHSETVMTWFVGLLLLPFAVKCISVALTTPFTFDGGIYSQVAQNLSHDLRYAPTYQGELFDMDVAAGVPLILPVAVLFHFFGETYASGLMVNALYMIALALALVYYLRQCARVHAGLTFLALLMLWGAPRLFYFGFGLLGEIPALFYMLLVLIFLNRYDRTRQTGYLFLTGLALGIGYLTKTVSLIIVPAILFALVFDFLVKRRLTLRAWPAVKRFFLDCLAIALGFFLVVSIFELFRLAALGFAGYLEWWQENLSFTLQMAGVAGGYYDTPGLIHKLHVHLGRLSAYWEVNKILLVGVVGVLFLAFVAVLSYGVYHYFKRQKPSGLAEKLFSLDILALMAVTLSYFGWWLVIVTTARAWDRYLLNGYILLGICLVIGVSFLRLLGEKLASRAGRAFPWLARIIFIAYTGCLVFGVASALIKSENYRISFTNTPEKTALLQAGGLLRSLPSHAVVYGFDWWQAPELAFSAGRPFQNLLTDPLMRQPGTFDHKYLVVDPDAWYLAKGGWQNILDQYNHQLVFSDDRVRLYIYKLISRDFFAYPDFTETEKAQVSYSKIQFFKKSPDAFVRNMYMQEKEAGGKWAQDVTGFLFKYHRQGQLKILLWMPDLANMDRQPVTLEVYANRQPVYRLLVDRSGDFEMLVPLENISGDTLEITLVCNARYKTHNDARPFSFLLRKMMLVR